MPSSSHTAVLAPTAAQPQRSASSTGISRSASAARCNVGAAAACPSSVSSSHAFKQQLEGAGSTGRRRKRPDGRPDLQDDRPPAPPCPPRPTRSGRSRARAPRRTAQAAWRPSAAAAEHRWQGPNAKATWPRSRSTRARWNSSSGPVSAVAGAPEPRRTRRPGGSPARRPARDPRGAPDHASARRRAAGTRPRRRPTARLRPAGRALELRGDLLIGSRRGRQPDASPPVGIDSPVGRLRQRAGGPPGVLHRRRSVNGGAHERMTEGHALAHRQQPVCFRSQPPRPRCRAARPPAQQQRIADWLGRRKQQRDAVRLGERARVVARSSPRSALSAPAPPAARSHPPAASPSARAATRARPADCRASPR